MTETRDEILLKAKKQKKRVVTFLLCSILALVICTGAVVGVALSLITEGAEAPEETAPIPVTSCPRTKGGTLSYVKKLTSAANDNRIVFVNSSVSLSIPDDQIELSGTDAEKNILKFMKGTLQSSLDRLYPDDVTGEFGTEFSDFPEITLNEADISDFTCEAGYENDKGESVNTDKYYAELTLNPVDYPHADNSAICKTFRMDEFEGIAEKLKNEFRSVLSVESLEIVPVNYQVKANAFLENDRIRELSLSRNYRITVKYSFIGDFAELGAQTLSFDYTVTEKFSYTWASVKFNTKEVSVKEGESVKLDIKATLNDYSDYEIWFDVSDESIATIDELGYVTGLKNSAEPVTVTVHIRYLGFEYEDFCTVYIRNSVEEIKISDDKKTVSVGDTFKLSAEVKPDNATVKDVIFKSSDESVATVSEDGTVTALSAGSVSITAVSVDGRWKDSCKLTVEEKGVK